MNNLSSLLDFSQVLAGDLYSDSLADILSISGLRTAHFKGESELQNPNCNNLIFLILIRIMNSVITP